MTECILNFENISWETPFAGLRTKSIIRDATKYRLVEFAPEFVEREWCIKAHAGFVIKGEMELNIDGEIKVLKAGDALSLPAGLRHKHHSTIKATRLFLIERA